MNGTAYNTPLGRISIIFFGPLRFHQPAQDST